MQEMIHDPFYEFIQGYDRCIIDYCLIKTDIPHYGYRSHKDAVLFAMCKVIERYLDYQLKAETESEDMDEEPFPWSLDITKAKAALLDPAALLSSSEKGNDVRMSYCHAFCNAPHGTGYGSCDFDKVNSVLFPNGEQTLEVYEWTTDWSSYFDAGHEWWGSACWSVYDRSADRYTVILASATD